MCSVLRLTIAAMILFLVAGCASTNGSNEEDPVDRMFEPLDHAVDEMNRDLNEGSDDDWKQKQASETP